MNAVAGERTPLLRPMFEEDVEAVMAIELQNYPYPWTAGIMRDCLRVRYSCWVLEEDEQIIGYAFLAAGAGEAHVLNVSIAQACQGRGLGRMLMLHLLERARSLGVDTVFLEVRPSNHVAVRLYESLGFNQAGLRRNYYPAENGHEDALVMALAL